MARSVPAALRLAIRDEAVARPGRKSRAAAIPLKDRLLLPRKLAAASLSVSLRVLDDLVRAGELKSVSIGSRRLFRRADLQRFVEQLGQTEL